MAAPETIVLESVKQLTEAIFTAEGWTVEFDKLPRSTGHDTDAAALAVYPETAVPDVRNRHVLIIPVVLQVYLPYEAKVDEAQRVDPRIVIDLANRLREGFRAGQQSTGDVWWLRIDEISYPDDPTGNKSRFEVKITGRGRNTAEMPA